MKKYLLIGLVLMLFFASTVSAITYTQDKSIVNDDENKTSSLSFTHTVFAEECTATWCPNCPMAAEALYNIYESGDYPFYYVAHINDVNSIAKQRLQEFSGFVKIYAFPTVYFDGGDTLFVGRGNNVAETEAEYRNLIEQVGQRTPKQPLTMDSTVTWNGDAKLSVTITIKNEGNFIYFGKLRSFVTEIESRWNDNDGNPYHFAFLDYAANQILFLMPGQSKTISGNFDGTKDHGGQTFEDITQDNIMVMSAIYHWLPNYRVGYQGDEYTQRFFAHYADQSTAAVPT